MKDLNYVEWNIKLKKISNILFKKLFNIYTNENREQVVIFDIDNTLIDEYGNCITPILDVYNYVKYLNITPIIITNRVGSGSIINFTKIQLENNGIYDYKYIYFRDKNEKNPYIYKKLARKDIYDNGMDIIMCIGDMPWDIGEYGGLGIIVPTLQK